MDTTYKSFIELKKDVILVKGALNSAIYDLNIGFVYSINSNASMFLESLLEHKTSFTAEETAYINQLKKLNLLDDVQINVRHFFPDNRYSLNFAWLELTGICNEKCLHCYGEFGEKKKEKSLTFNQWKDVLTQLKNSRCEKIQFIGGEPLMYPHFEQLLEHAIKLDFNDITVFTNATLITKSLISEFKKHNIKVKVSLYGHKPEVHDAITQIRGSFKRTILNLENLKANGIQTTIAVIIMKENEKYINEILSFIRSSNLGKYGYDVIRKVFGGKQSSHLPSETITRLKYQKEPEFYTNKYLFEKSLFENTCWFGKFAIASNGNVLPCVFERNKSYGNVIDDSISQILSSEKLQTLWDLNKDLVNVCKDCEFRYACKDCRPLGECECGDLFGKYSRCTYNPYTGIWNL